MASKLVWVEIASGLPVSIFKNQKQAIIAAVPIQEWLYVDAVEKIRRAVFVRDDYSCTHCGASVRWDGPGKGHMHERQWRGHGGVISVENSTTLCAYCHEHDKIAGHGNRKPQWSSFTKSEMK